MAEATVRELIEWAVAELERQGVPAARWDAEVLLGAALSRPALELLLHRADPVPAAIAACFRAQVAKRAEREPLQYVLGRQEFMGLEFFVNSDVLVPRPDTEHLAEAALEWLNGEQVRQPILPGLMAVDLCTGSGALAVTLAKQIPTLRVIATDLSEAALSVARANAERHGVADRITFRSGDLFAALPADCAGQVALLVSNPPYIPSSVLPQLQLEVQHEPRLALDGGPDGLSFYRRIIAEAPRWLNRTSAIALEVGHDQGDAVLALLAAELTYHDCALRKDYAGHDRVVLAKIRGD